MLTIEIPGIETDYVKIKDAIRGPLSTCEYEGALAIDITFHFAPPKSTSRKRREQMISESEPSRSLVKKMFSLSDFYSSAVKESLWRTIRIDNIGLNTRYSENDKVVINFRNSEHAIMPPEYIMIALPDGPHPDKVEEVIDQLSKLLGKSKFSGRIPVELDYFFPEGCAEIPNLDELNSVYPSRIDGILSQHGADMIVGDTWVAPGVHQPGLRITFPDSLLF